VHGLSWYQSPVSASVAEVAPTLVAPTAVHPVSEPHDTPLSEFNPALMMLGLDRSFHVVPFHTSTSVKENMELLAPTAAHEVGELHDTPASEMFDGLAGFGVRCTIQPCPRHTSATVSCEVEPK